jgi:hypothetical protein
MADKPEKPILVETKGVNEIQIGAKSSLSVIKIGQSKELRIKDKHLHKGKKIRWVWIATEYLEEAKKMLSGQVFDKWGEWNSKNAKEPIQKYGIGKQYVYGNGVTTKTTEKDLAEGRIYYFEPFINAPTLDRGNYIATIDTPKILSAYFARYKDEFKYPGESGTSNIYTYKNSIKLYVLGHMLPNYTVEYHNFTLFEVAIWDTDGNQVTEKDKPLRFFQKPNSGTFSANTMTELQFIIDEKWRDKSKHEENTVKTYYAKIKTTIYSNEDTFTGDEVGDIKENHLITANENPRNNHRYLKFTNKFKSVAPNNDIVGVVYTKEDEAVSQSGWGRDTGMGKRHAAKYTKEEIKEVYDTTKGTVLENQQVSFRVKYDTMDVILDNYEIDKNNMFVVVGDVEYSAKSNEPCKYSKLQIEHKSRTEPFVLFDEDSPTPVPIDHTNLVFGIVAGDTKETITITAEGLAIQNYHPDQKDKPRCLGITTAIKRRGGIHKTKKQKHRNQEEFKHNSIEDVFTMDKAYILYPDAISATTNPNPETTGSETIDIQGQDIEHNYIDNGIELKVGYLYNKTFDSRAEKWLGDTAGEWTNDLIDIAWIVRYFYLNDNINQKYFIPIGTCRYPNQVANIGIFPDVEWWINFNYKAKNPYHVYQKPNYGYRVITTEKNQNQKNAANYRSSKTKTKDNSYKLEFEAGFKYNGQTIKFNSGDGFPLINAINFFLKAYEVFKKITFADETSDKESSIASGTAVSSKPFGAKKMTQRYKARKSKGLPFKIKVSRPSFSGGIYGSYKQSKNDVNTVGAMYEAKFAANPLFSIEGKLDLLFFAQFIGPIGLALDKISKVVKRVDYLTLGAVKIDYFLNLAAEVKLNIDISGINHHSIDGWGGAEVNADMPIKVWLEAGVNVDVNLQGVAKLDADAKIEGIANMDLQITLDKRTNKLPMEFTFKGLDVKIWLSLNARSDEEDEDEDEDEDEESTQEKPSREPDATRNLIPEGKPYKFNIL